MFTGLVEEIGSIVTIRDIGGGRRIRIQCRKILEDIAIDDSICINGACLTVVQVGPKFFEADAVSETVARTTIKSMKTGDWVNLERALQLSDRLGGHWIQGHVDGTGRISGFNQLPNNTLLSVEILPELEKYVISKGSIAVDGISLTVANLEANQVTVAVIPHTIESTTLQYRRVNDIVNIEVDLIGKYVYKFLERMDNPSKLSLNWLKEQGFA
jgi:riboflavin synthase